MEATDLVKEIRALGVSQSEIARRLDVSQPYVSDVERGLRGKRARVEFLKSLRKLCREVKGEQAAA